MSFKHLLRVSLLAVSLSTTAAFSYGTTDVPISSTVVQLAPASVVSGVNFTIQAVDGKTYVYSASGFGAVFARGEAIDMAECLKKYTFEDFCK